MKHNKNKQKQDSEETHVVNIDIKGMHCASCEVIIERKLKKIEGVEHVNVDQAKGEAIVKTSRNIPLHEFKDAINNDEYRVLSKHELDEKQLSSKPKYGEIGGALVLLFAIYILFDTLDIVPNLGVSDTMTLGLVFVIGLFAAVSTCMAVTGGLLIAISTKYSEMHPNLSGIKKFKPHLYFNAGRLVGYAVLGGAVGALGSIISFSPKSTGILMLVASVLMIVIGLQFLHIFPWLDKFKIKMPKILAHKIHDHSLTTKKTGPFALGAATFFLPCGFTQALQLYVLGKGDIMTGAIVMFVFALGTVPALLSVGALTSFFKGSVQRHVIIFSGVLLIVLGVFNANNSLAIVAPELAPSTLFGGNSNPILGIDDNVKIVNGKQVISMKVIGYDYYPSRFKIYEGIPVEWAIDATQAKGCARVITAPGADILEYLPASRTKTITFTPSNTGFIKFGCTMWMTTPGAGFEVVENTKGIKAGKIETVGTSGSEICDPKKEKCEVQKFNLEISREKGFYPNTFNLKKGVPVEIDIDAKFQLGGCMGAMVIAPYDIVHPLTMGKTTLKFTPTKSGTVLGTCSMGSKMVTFNVV